MFTSLVGSSITCCCYCRRQHGYSLSCCTKSFFSMDEMLPYQYFFSTSSSTPWLDS